MKGSTADDTEFIKEDNNLLLLNETLESQSESSISYKSEREVDVARKSKVVQMLSDVKLSDPNPDFRQLFSFDTFKELVLEVAELSDKNEKLRQQLIKLQKK